MKRILLIDNYDSFTYNVLHLLNKVFNNSVDIVKNDYLEFETIDIYSHIVISPGPGIPSEAGSILKVIDLCKKSHSILGICLGHQAIAEYFGAKLINLSTPLHGHKSTLFVNAEDPILGPLTNNNSSNNKLHTGLYHSWAIDKPTIPSELEVVSRSESGIVMSIYHKSLNIYGMQFHPESIITERGREIIASWGKYSGLIS